MKLAHSFEKRLNRKPPQDYKSESQRPPTSSAAHCPLARLHQSGAGGTVNAASVQEEGEVSKGEVPPTVEISGSGVVG